MKFVFSEEYKGMEGKIHSFIDNFEQQGRMLGDGNRNTIKIFPLEETKVNIKSFRIPNAINQLAYRFFRPSKAERSFSYAQRLLRNGIGTPVPIAYAEETQAFKFLRSYYVSEQLDYEHTFREIDLKKEGHEEILRAFTRFTFELHEKEIEFLDHSPGNTLIRKEGEQYRFYLVDLNRMTFKPLNFTERMKNFCRLTPKKEVLRIMAEEYAGLINRPAPEVFEKMWFFTEEFQAAFHRKKRLKKKLKFWK